jgi:hypothetical protein
VLGNLGEDVTLEGLAEGEGEGNLGDAPVDSLRELCAKHCEISQEISGRQFQGAKSALHS